MWWLLLACAPEEPLPLPPVVLTEVVPRNTTAGGGLVDWNGNSSDWFELRNTSPEPVDLTGLFVSDHPEERGTWAFPEGTVVDRGGLLLVFASGAPSADGEVHAPIQLTNGGVLWLHDASGFAVDSIQWPALLADHSWALIGEEWVVDSTPTPLEPNAP